jgi:hypothetical protein
MRIAVGAGSTYKGKALFKHSYVDIGTLTKLFPKLPPEI